MEIYDDFTLNKRLKEIEYKADSIFWECKNVLETSGNKNNQMPPSQQQFNANKGAKVNLNISM